MWFRLAIPLNTQDEMRVILESAYPKIQGFVDDAKAKLGIKAGAVIDTSPEATTNRILDFSLGFFEQYRENHSDLNNKEAHEQFAEFIGGAIQEGIDEARETLGALSAIDDTTEYGIVPIENLIQDVLNSFVLGNQVRYFDSNSSGTLGNPTAIRIGNIIAAAPM